MESDYLKLSKLQGSLRRFEIATVTRLAHTGEEHYQKGRIIEHFIV
jgi:hypothetical protein